MAIDPKLVSIKEAKDLPTAEAKSTSDFLFFEDQVLKKSPMSNIYDKVTSGIKGEATQTNAPTVYTPEAYPNGLFETYVVRTPLTMPNSWGSAVTQAELDANYVFFDVRNGVITKAPSKKQNGDSAYQIALNNGFVGTEAEWLASLEGSVNLADEFDKTNDTDAQTAKNIFDFLISNLKREEEFILNILPEAFVFSGYMDDNAILTPNIAWRTTDYIKVEKNDKLNLWLYGASQEFSITAVSISDDDKLNETQLLSFPTNVYYVENLWFQTINIPRNGFIRISNRVYNLKSNYKAELHHSAVEQLYITPDDLVGESKDLSLLSINDFNFEFDNNLDFERFNDGFIAPNGGFISNTDTSHIKARIKKGLAYSFSMVSIASTPSQVVIYDDNNGNFSKGHYNVNSLFNDTFIASGDGWLYLNQNKTHETINFITTIYLSRTKGNVKDYIDYKTTSFTKSYINIDIQQLIPNSADNANGKIAGQSKFMSNMLTAAGFFVSRLIPVKAGMDFVFDGYIGTTSGVLQYDVNGVYIKPLLLGNDSNVTASVFSVEHDGFIQLSTLPNSKLQFIKYIPTGENSATEDKKIINLRTFNIEKPNFARFDIKGIMPRDASPARTPTDIEFDFSVAGEKIFTAKGSIEIQGNASATYTKKGYAIDIMNFENESLKIKFGDMIAADGFNLKAYATDATHTRDIGMGRAWQDWTKLNPYPESKVNNIPFILNQTNTDILYNADAKYVPDGFPVEIYVNGSFHGLHTLKHKKTRENYSLSSSVKTHIFLDNADYSAFLNTGFVYSKWEVRNPKMSGYDEMQPVPDPTVLASIERFFNWAKDFHNNTGTARADHANYIVLKNWIDYKIFCEVFNHRDSVGNNENIITWNGNQWVFCPYDMDISIGLNPFDNGGIYNLETTRTGFLNGDLWAVFRTYFDAQIKSRYTELRNQDFISTDNLSKYFTEIARHIPREVYKNDAIKWGNIWVNGTTSIEHIKLFLKNRIDYLDTQWLLP